MMIFGYLYFRKVSEYYFFFKKEVERKTFSSTHPIQGLELEPDMGPQAWYALNRLPVCCRATIESS